MLRHLTAACLAAFSFASPLSAEALGLRLLLPCAAATPVAEALAAEGFRLAERRTEVRGFAVEDWRGPAGWVLVLLLRDGGGEEVRCLAFQQGGAPA